MKKIILIIFLSLSIATPSVVLAASNRFNTNIGIGKEPTSQLDVEGVIQASSSLTAESIFFTDGTEIKADSVWDTDGTNVYRSTGNVGIGTATPSTLLDLTTSGNKIGLMIGQEDNAENGDLLRVNTITTTGTLTVTAKGDVGLGTTSPSGRLNVVSPYAKTYASYISSTEFSTNDASAPLKLSFGLWGSATGSERFGSLEVLETGGSKRTLALQPWGGNVGIGTTSPSALLDLTTSGNKIALMVGQEDNAETGNLLQINTVTSSGVFIVDEQGNVGKGVSDPWCPFDIQHTFTTPSSWDGLGYFKATTTGTSESWTGFAAFNTEAETQVTGAGTAAAYSLISKARTADDGDAGQEAWGVSSSVEVHPGDTGYCLEAGDESDSTGGSAYGLYINLNDTDITTRYGIYQNSANDNYFAGNIGIGDDPTPDGLLEVSGPGNQDVSIFFDLGDTDSNDVYLRMVEDEFIDYRGGFLRYGNTTGEFQFGVHDANDKNTGSDIYSITIQRSDGNVGIGTASPNYQLELSTNSAGKPVSGTWSIVSDRRLKENIYPFTDGLDTIMHINPVHYQLNGKAGLPKGEEGISIIAQDILDVAPYTIKTFNAKLEPTDAEKTELYDFDASPLTFVLINAVKELKRENDELRARIEALEALQE